MNRFKRKLKDLIPAFLSHGFREYKKKIEEKHYEGDQVTCCICGSRYRIFAPHGPNKRQNARCINCSSLERHRLLYTFMKDRTTLFSGEELKMMHVAPEKVFYELFSASPFIDYYPCDLFPNRYAYNGTTRILKVDITAIPFENDFFDVILCNHVLEHISDEQKAMSELNRVLKPGGWGIFQVPLDHSLEKTYENDSITSSKGREKAFGQYDHVRLYGRDYKDRLAAAGFKVREDHFVEQFQPDEIFRYGFDPQEVIYFCKK